MSVFRFAKAAGIALLAMCFVSACQTEEEKEQAERIAFEEELGQAVYGVQSVHSIVTYPTNSPAEITVPDFFYSHIVVDAVPWLTSKDIKDIVPLERPLKTKGIYDLQIILTKHGREQWEKLLSADFDKNFAVQIDGVFYQSFHPRRMYKRGSDSVVIDGPFNDVIAELLRKRAPFNYLKLNGMDKEILKFRQNVAPSGAKMKTPEPSAGVKAAGKSAPETDVKTPVQPAEKDAKQKDPSSDKKDSSKK